MPRVLFAAVSALALLGACTGSDDGPSTVPDPVAPQPVAPVAGELLIEELYYSGAAPQGGTDHYYSDQFVELVNASDHPLDLSGVLIGDAFGVAGPINPGTSPDSFAASRPDDVVLSSVWRIPEGVALDPGQTLVLAHDGTNHRPFSTIDLSGAGLETFVDSARGNDTDHPTVPNLEEVVFNGGYDWLITVFGPSVVVLSAGTELGTETGPYSELATAPTSAVLDAVETLMDGDSGAFKRLPDHVDAGFAWVDGPYVGQSIRRKRTGAGWQDTDDSSADFEVGAPDPGEPPPSEAVWGEPWIELGTGVVAFEPLDDGDDIELVAGIQGGWHLDATLRFDGFGPSGVALAYEALSLDAEPLSFVTEATLQDGSVLTDDDGFVRLGDRVVLDIRSASEVVDSDVILRVTASLDGQTWSDERRLHIVEAR
jgi:hypothetical protein